MYNCILQIGQLSCRAGWRLIKNILDDYADAWIYHFLYFVDYEMNISLYTIVANQTMVLYHVAIMCYKQ